MYAWCERMCGKESYGIHDRIKWAAAQANEQTSWKPHSHDNDHVIENYRYLGNISLLFEWFFIRIILDRRRDT